MRRPWPKTGAAVYDAFPKELREQFVRDWEEEVNTLLKTIEAIPRGNKSKKVAHDEQLKALVKNDPPFFKKTGKTGAASYEGFKEPIRSKLVKDWEGEKEAVKKAIEEDKERFRNAKTAEEIKKYSDYIKSYSERLMKLEQNDPPYFKKE